MVFKVLFDFLIVESVSHSQAFHSANSLDFVDALEASGAEDLNLDAQEKEDEDLAAEASRVLALVAVLEFDDPSLGIKSHLPVLGEAEQLPQLL